MKAKTKFIVITGGPGAGKTALLELVKKQAGSDIAILPEAASILFGGGFWRLPSVSARIAAQKSIFYIQRQMEFLVEEEKKWSVGFCDRGTVDALAYWPKSEKHFWQTLQTSRKTEFKKYALVIHLRTPSDRNGYNHQNPIRTESSEEAAKIDHLIEKAWMSHPHYFQIASTQDFLEKVRTALDLISSYIPAVGPPNEISS